MDPPPPYNAFDTGSRTPQFNEAAIDSSTATARHHRKATLTLHFYRTPNPFQLSIMTIHIRLMLLYPTLTICPHMHLSDRDFPAYICAAQDPHRFLWTAWPLFAFGETESGVFDCETCDAKAWLSCDADTGLLALNIERVWDRESVGGECEVWLMAVKTEVWNSFIEGSRLDVEDGAVTKVYRRDYGVGWRDWPVVRDVGVDSVVPHARQSSL